MPLEEIEKKLYRRDEEPLARPERPGSPKARETPRAGAAWGKVEEVREPRIPSFRPAAPGGETRSRLKRILFWGIVIFAIGSAAVLLYLTFARSPEIAITVSGPRELRAGTKGEFELVIENRARVELEKTSLTVRAGSGVVLASTPERVSRKEFPGAFAPKSVRKERITVYALGKQGEEREFEVAFRYRPSNIESEFVKTEKVKMVLTGPAVSIELGLPTQALSQNAFTFSVNWQNTAEIPLREPAVTLRAPADFNFADSNPKPTGTNLWKFDDLSGGQHGTLAVTGSIDATPGQTRKFQTVLTTRVREDTITLAETDREVAIIENPLVVAMSINGESAYKANPGETLEYRITFKNNFQETLRDIVIVAKLKGRMFDIREVKSSGAYDSRDFSITFNGGNTPQLLFLEPNESGSVTFTVALYKDFPDRLQNNVLVVDAEMTSATKPKYLGLEGQVSARTSIEAQVNGILTVNSRVLVRDPASGFAGSGPWPMRQDQTTQFAAHITISAKGNDFDNLSIVTVLPDNVSFAGNARGNISGTQVLANPRTKKVEWQISKLAAYQSKELIFQIDVTPSAAQVGSAINLFGEVSADAIDQFTKNVAHLRTQVLRSDALDDPTILPQNRDTEGRVQP